jgi:hypothetical protein
MLIGACKEVAAVGESDLTAQLDADLLELLEASLENIHHANLVSETYYDMETRGMESKGVCLILENFANLQGLSMIVPDADCLVGSTGTNELLLNADVHAINAAGVERIDKIFVFSIIGWSFNVNRNSHQLIVLSGEYQGIFGTI